MKLKKPLTDGLIPNHPEIRINRFTHPIDKASKIVLEILSSGALIKSKRSGAPRDEKSE